MKEYEKINEIKISNASTNYIEGTLCLEGGAFRGIYTAGVLDCLMDNDINLTNVIGVSAGALNGMNYIAGNRGRGVYCDLKHRFNKRWIGKRNLLKHGGFINSNFYFTDLDKEIPFNYDRLYDGKRKFIAVATNLRTGKAEYFTNKNSLIIKAVKASSSMPFISEPIKIVDQKYLDGGCATKLPIRYAVDNNYPKIIFVGTRPMSYRRDTSKRGDAMLKLSYRKYKNFIKAMEETNKRYNDDMDYIQKLESENKIFVIAPSKSIVINRLEDDLNKLRDYYDLGYNDTLNNLTNIKKFLNI